MTREEFTALPLAIALGMIWDALVDGDSLRHISAPEMPMAPKYDRKIFCRDGYYWASETTLRDLQYHHRRAAEGVDDERWGEQNRKTAAALDRWIAWRTVSPAETWSGVRGQDDVTAAAPRAKPHIYPRDYTGSGTTAQPRQPAAEPSEDFDSPDGQGFGDGDDLPF